MTLVYALVVAAGRGSRFGGAVPKQYLALGGASVLRHAVAALAEHPRISGVLVVIRPEDQGLFERAVAGLPVLAPVAGGPTRQDSVRLGLEALTGYRPARVLIHDPEILLIDELSLGLAPIVVERLLAVVEQLKAQGQTMLIVEQSLNVALSVADRAMTL